MRYLDGSDEGLAIRAAADTWLGVDARDPEFPGWIGALLAEGGDALHRAAAVLRKGRRIDEDRVIILPPLRHPPKIICVGLNYADHTK